MLKLAGGKNKPGISEEYIFNGYSKRKLHCLSETYEKLADLYREVPDEESSCGDRKDILYQRQIRETKKMFASHLDEISDAFSEVAETVVHVSMPLERKRKAIIQYLKKKGVVVREFVFLDEDSFGEGRISIEARAAGKNTMSATALGGFLSDFFDRRLVPSSESAMTLGRVYDTFIYEDEPRYNMLSAVSRAVREDEKVSGDNFSLEEYNQSQVIMMIADGMGSGEQACRDSQSVIEFMERFMEAGFQKEKAFTMVNGALASQTGGCNLTTLDVCAVNLLTGEAEFMKAGAAASYIKHGKRVDEISQDTLPLGSRQELSPITQGIKLSDTDMIIMVSDGISESIENEGRTSLKEVLSKSRASNPRELSDFILQYAINCQGGRIRDDMTVLACMLAEMGD